MLETEKRKAIFLLHEEGMGTRDIARRLKVSRNTVRAIITQQGAAPQPTRPAKVQIDDELLRKLYENCEGRAQRVYEKLTEEENIQVTYSTLTRLLRERGISKPPQLRCGRVPDEPGAEMQHDTSPYTLEIGGQKTAVIASMLYLRYSKRRFLKFYRSFNRFKMKCFLHEALMFWGYAPKACIIDNTNLARLRGTGKNALILPEMESFARQFEFYFLCHERKHSDRKAGEERSFWTVETNFFPGRKFESFEDLNAQAYAWATVRMEHRPQGKARLIPVKAFEFECAYLAKLSPQLPAPYLVHERGTDQYGYVAFNANYYWVPGTTRDDLKVLEYSDKIVIYRAHEHLIDYPLPAEGVRNKLYTPQGVEVSPHQPRNSKKRSLQEEQALRAMGAQLEAYVVFVHDAKGVTRHEFFRKLLALSRRMTPALFIRSIERAHRYRITDIPTIERIAALYLRDISQELPSAEVDAALEQRETFQAGLCTDSPDFSVYDDLYNISEGIDEK